MSKRRSLRPGTRGEELVGGMIGAFFGYVVAEGTLARYMHPLHWLAAIIVALIVYSSTLLWYRWRYPKRRSVNQQSVRPPWYRRWRVGRRDE